METSAPSAQSGRVSPSPPFQTKTKGSALVGFSCGSAGEESAYSAGDLGSIPGLGTSPGEGKGYSLQYSGLENSMDCIFHGVANSWTRLSDFSLFYYNLAFY